MNKIENHNQELEIFKNRILQDALILNIKEKNILHYIDMIVTEVEKTILKIVPVEDPNDIKHLQRKWVAVYKEGFEKLSGTPLLTGPKSEHFVMIEHALKLLKEQNSNIDDYMKYLFEDYYPANMKMLSSGIGMTVSKHLLQKFLLDKKEEIQKTSDEDKKKKDQQDVLSYFREIMRKPEIANDQTKLDTLKKMYSDLKNGIITHDEFKQKLINF